MIKISPTVADIYWGFDKAYQEITRYEHRVPCVVLWAYTSIGAHPDQSRLPWNKIKPVMQQLFDADVPIVIPAGNYRTSWSRSKVDTLPALWEGPTFPLIVAGSVDDYGNEAYFSQGPNHVTVWAPGVEVHCAKKGQGSKGISTGTSMSTGTVRWMSLSLKELNADDLRLLDLWPTA